MKRMGWMVVVCLALAGSACKKGGDNNGSNNGSSNNGSNNGVNNGSNNGVNNGSNNNGVNNGSNNGSNNNGVNNGSNNNGVNNGSSNNGSNNATGPIAVEDFAATIIETYCEAAFNCTTSTFYQFEAIRLLMNTYGDEASCRAAAAELAASGLYNDADLIASVTDGRYDYDPVVARTCIDAIKQSLCDEDFDDTACEGLFTGTVQDGGGCSASDQCAAEASSCDFVDGQCFGTCAVPNPNECGAAVCLDTQYCDFSSTTCADRVADGMDCTSPRQCAAGSTCDYDFNSGAGTCVAEKSVTPGGGCFTDAVCQDGYVCGAMNTCAPLGMDGDVCEFDSDCADPLVCNYSFDTDSGLCVMEGSVPQGEYCYDSTFCMDGHFCDFSTETCEVGGKTGGEECFFDNECADGLVCLYQSSTGTGGCAMTGIGGEGSACDRNEICVDGFFCDSFGSETCTTAGASGDSCGYTRPCAPGLACLMVDQNSFEGTCGALLDSGATCDDWSQCKAPLGCIDGTCQPRRATGACESILDCASLSCDEGSLMCTEPMVCMVP